MNTRVEDAHFGSARLLIESGSEPERHGFTVQGASRAEELASATMYRYRRWRSPPEPEAPAAAPLPSPPPRPPPPPAEPIPVVFDAIKGGRGRAQEIVDTILRQKHYLRHLGQRREHEPETAEAEEEAAAPRVLLGPGVVEWVEANGGRLFVWGDDFGEGFEWMKASIDPPEGVDFVRVEDWRPFELYVERTIAWTRPIRLERRWFGLRDGIAVDTGLVSG